MADFDSTTSSHTPLLRTDLPLPGRREGKVRDIYSVPATADSPPAVLIIATDRISAFDVVMPTPIAGKGALLTDISLRWFDMIRDRLGISHHVLSTQPEDVPGLPKQFHDSIRGRMMLGRATQVIPVECVVRGYITGSGWLDYQETGGICGIQLPAGLKQCERLPEPIFTPATKAEVGEHDENIDLASASAIAGEAVMDTLRKRSIQIYEMAAKHAESRGVILADTKFEFGLALDRDGQATDELILIDEVLTPDSSRYWPADDYEPGRDQDSFDKQYVRNHLLELVAAGTWNKSAPGPSIPDDIAVNTVRKYEEARAKLFGA